MSRLWLQLRRNAEPVRCTAFSSAGGFVHLTWHSPTDLGMWTFALGAPHLPQWLTGSSLTPASCTGWACLGRFTCPTFGCAAAGFTPWWRPLSHTGGEGNRRIIKSAVSGAVCSTSTTRGFWIQRRVPGRYINTGPLPFMQRSPLALSMGAAATAAARPRPGGHRRWDGCD